MKVPEFTTWEDAFIFANEELVRSLEALSHGDFVIARALNESGKEANAVARQINEASHG